ncbi:MAG: DUF2341 domain-containing protein [Acidimicrobiales bacterium]
MSRRTRRVARIVGRTLNAAALLVAVTVIAAVVAVGAGLAAGYRPVVITGGSMGEAMPDRSLVVARPAERVAVGDVLVMRRTGRATITHRVTELEPGAEGGPLLAITRGDANEYVDPAPYPLGRRELVARWTIPALGGLVLRAATPLVGSAIVTLVVLILATAALRRIWRSDPPGGSSPGSPSAAPGTVAAGRTRRRRAGAVAAVGVLLAAATVAWALYVDSAGVPANQFSASGCWDAKVAGVQKGTTTSTAIGTQTVTIDAVDTTRSFLTFTVRSTGNEPEDSRVLGRLATGTTVTFQRNGDNPSPPTVTIEWSVVTYSCGVTVQRGTAAPNGTATIDVPISTVDTSASFVLGTSVPDTTALTYGGNDLVAYELTSSTNLRISTDTEAAVGAAAFGWQVITFDDPGDIDVQTVSATLGTGTGTTTVALSAPVDLASTFVLASPYGFPGGAAIGDRMIRARLLDASTVEVYRAVTTESVGARIQVVTLNEGTTVQRGLVTMSPGTSVATAGLSPVDVGRSTAFTTVMEPGSLSGGSTSHTADDVPGEGSATVTLPDATSVSLRRATSLSTATFAWQVVTWGGPGWADASYLLRQRIDVTAGSVDSPTGYTTSVVVDHASLVASGLSLPSGDDLRLWRHDGTTWSELDRVLDPASAWNSPNTTVWFRTQESISAGETVSYWLYFAKPTAGAPPADPDNVWLLREGFESGLGSFTDRTDGTGWYQAQPWTRRITLSVAESAVDGTLTSQPVLVRLTSADLAAHAQADGSDIRFTGADGTTALPHEIEAYDPGSGTLTAWVLVPSVDATTNTTVQMYYGASDAPAQAAPRAVWGNELAAWHLSRSRTGPAPSLDDSSTSGLDGRALGDTALTDTASGPANDLDGVTDRLESAPRDLPDGPLTVSAWFRPDVVTGSPVLLAQGDPSGTGAFELAVVAGVPRFRLRAGAALAEVSGGTVSAGAWHLVTATWNGSTVTLYVDGAPAGATPASGATVDGSGIAMTLGGDAAGSRTLDGQLGEARVSVRAWSAAEVRFAYQNLADPGGTVTAGAATAGTWFAPGTWTVRRPITVDHTLVAGNLTDFPLLVQVADASLGVSGQADGDDLVFTAADGVTRLDHDLESWDAGTGTLTAWVRIPSLSATVDTELFLYSGNANAASQEDPVGVWGAESDLVLTGG